MCEVGAVYEHYKGKEYTIVAIARHSENDDFYCVYRALYEPYTTFVRPLCMFFDNVTVHGVTVPRFKKVV